MIGFARPMYHKPVRTMEMRFLPDVFDGDVEQELTLNNSMRRLVGDMFFCRLDGGPDAVAMSANVS